MKEIGFEPITGNKILEKNMSHQNFESLSYIKFRKFHSELNDYVKLSTSAIDHLRDKSRSKSDLTKLISTLISQSGERWSPQTYDQPFQRLDELRIQLTKSAIMWVYSSFEVFLNHVHGICSQVEANSYDIQIEEDKESKRLLKLYEMYEWNFNEIKYLFVVYNYYSLARHCIVHNMGKANNDLTLISQSEDFKNALDNWPTVIKGRTLSPPPEIDKEGNIFLSPHHAITYSDVCFRISQNINRRILEHLTPAHYLKRIVKNKILDASDLDTPICRDLNKYLRYQMKEGWKFDAFSDSEIKEMLENLGIRKETHAKYKQLKMKKAYKK